MSTLLNSVSSKSFKMKNATFTKIVRRIREYWNVHIRIRVFDVFPEYDSQEMKTFSNEIDFRYVLEYVLNEVY